MEEDDIEQPPASEPTLDEVSETQINRMAGCARMGKWMLYALMAGIAVSLMYRGCSRMMSRTESGRWDGVKSTMKDLTIATGNFRTEYNRFPLPAPIDETKDMFLRSKGAIFAALLGQDDKQNPRKIKFVDLPLAKDQKNGLSQETGEWVLVDRWGEMYYLGMDTNEDNRIDNPESEGAKSQPFLSASIIVYSSGPDRDPKTWEDNVCSWR
ncbi:MAG: hypothetical protein V4672_12830 [Verrucomicrobiota bacterium]